MKEVIAGIAVVTVTILCLLAMWRLFRAWGVLQRPVDTIGPVHDVERAFLADEKQRHLKSLKEIAFDHETGKIDAHDFQTLRRRHELAAADSIRALDAIDQRSEET